MPSSPRNSGTCDTCTATSSANTNSPASKRMKFEHSSSSTECVEQTTTLQSTDKETKEEKVYEEVTISQWWEGFHDIDINKDDNGEGMTNNTSSSSSPPTGGQSPLPLVDLRCNVEYNHRHLNLMELAPTGSTSSLTSRHTKVVHLPFHSLQSGERSCELPPRHVKFAILLPNTINIDGGADSHKDINADLSTSTSVPNISSGHQKYTRQEIEELFFATMSKATAQTRKPWLVKQVIVDSDALWEEAKEIGILDTSKDVCASSNENNSDESNREGRLRLARKLSRLWEPDRMVERVLLPLLQEKIQDFVEVASSPDTECSSSSTRQFTVWDLGSGAGRDVSFLAEELKSSLTLTQKDPSSSNIKLRVVGIDNHKGSARRCIPLWKNRFVDDVTESRLQNLNTIPKFKEHLQQEKSGLVCLYAIRFLNRKLVEYIANDTEFVQTGCLFAMSHFCKEKDGEWKWDHPKPSSVLDRDELSSLFTRTGHWRILHNELCSDGDHGRNLLQFVAERCN